MSILKGAKVKKSVFLFLICNLFVLSVACSSDDDSAGDNDIEATVFSSPRGEYQPSGDMVFLNFDDVWSTREKAQRRKARLKKKKKKLKKKDEKIAELQRQLEAARQREEELFRKKTVVERSDEQHMQEAGRWQDVAFATAAEVTRRKGEAANWQEIAQRQAEKLRRLEELKETLMGQLEGTARDLEWYESGGFGESDISLGQSGHGLRFPFGGNNWFDDVNFRADEH